jgi:hypothetical protein
MESLYSEVVLCVQNNLDVADVVRILQGDLTIAAASEVRGQSKHFFDGDADVLVLSYSTDSEELQSESDAKKILKGVNVDKIFREHIIPNLAKSEVSLELVVRYCNVSTDTIIGLSDAIRLNTRLVGFNIFGNPGNCEMGSLALKYACIHSQAPIVYFQGELLDEAILELRDEAYFEEDKEDSDIHQRSDTLDTINTTLTAVSSPIAVKRGLNKTREVTSKSPRDGLKPLYCRRVATEPTMGRKDNGNEYDYKIPHTWRTPTTNWMEYN